ncbi:hypothetical protein BpHYR1_030777 [Brachionus plicatilis]|uniref:Uncharacterized protein n=1 Tax=Brachionus plicatilis TaxID=10195 RepID=A0A3M7RIW6_BRAPC|nr:hypothetical protein BpHYR1_030777 [Brachionus plicatilis]
MIYNQKIDNFRQATSLENSFQEYNVLSNPYWVTYFFFIAFSDRSLLEDHESEPLIYPKISNHQIAPTAFSTYKF